MLPENGKIPNHTYGALRMYVDNHIKPGSFLTAVLSNDLVGACINADYINRHFIYELVLYCQMYLPPDCWGSPENVYNWTQNGK